MYVISSGTVRVQYGYADLVSAGSGDAWCDQDLGSQVHMVGAMLTGLPMCVLDAVNVDVRCYAANRLEGKREAARMHSAGVARWKLRIFTFARNRYQTLYMISSKVR